MIEGMTPFEKGQLSAAWLPQFEASTAADHWVHGFRLLDRSSGTIVGFCSFKGPPTDGVVEIAYGIAPEDRKGLRHGSCASPGRNWPARFLKSG